MGLIPSDSIGFLPQLPACPIYINVDSEKAARKIKWRCERYKGTPNADST